MNKSHILFFISSIILLASTLVFLSATRTRHAKPELPIMQQFSATPRFENEQTIFGKTYDLSRYDLHERFERELTNICYTHNTSILTIKRANRYFPILVPILEEEGIPADFIYLCCIESNLYSRAKSPAGACGLWQFMTETARQYGLIVNDEVDERYNIEKSTRAACKYLKDAYARFGDWMTVAASYNGGMAGIRSKLNTQKADSPMELILPEETSRYMFRLMAYKELLRDPYRYGFVLYSDQLYRPIRTTTVTVRNSIPDLADYAKKQGIDYFQLKEFNPWLRDNKLTFKKGSPASYKISIPLAKDLYYDANEPFEVYNSAWIVDK
jgi:hypothetical protein